MKKKIVGYSLLSLLVIVILAFFTGALDVVLVKVFGVAKADAKREVFEESKSYTHGKIQDLAKYYEEWQKKPEDHDAIEGLIKMNFAEFDAEKIKPLKLRAFLKEVRGY